MRRVNFNLKNQITFLIYLTVLPIFLANPAYAQTTTPLPTIECDGIVQGCWVIDVPESETTPADCMLEFLSLAKIEVKACNTLDASMEEKISLDIYNIESAIVSSNFAESKSKIDKIISGKLLNIKKKIEQDKETCHSVGFKNILNRVKAIQSAKLVEKIIQLKIKSMCMSHIVD